MDKFCDGKPFWDTNLTWNSDWPELTDCFQSTVVVWTSSSWLWVTLPVYTWYLLTRELKHNIKYSNRFIAKTVITLLCIITCVVDFIVAVSNLSGSYWKAVLVAPCINAATLILVLVYIWQEQRRGFVTSGVLFIYWLLVIVTNVIPFYTKIMKKTYTTRVVSFINFYIYFILAFIQLVIYCFAESPSSHQNKKECPELQASFLSRITYQWMHRLLMKGYKKPLTEDDVFDLNPRDKSRNVIPRFEANWKKEEAKLNSRCIKGVRPEQINYRRRQAQIHLWKDVTETTPLIGKHKDSKSSSPSSPHSKKPSLPKVLIKTFGLEFLHAQVFKLVFDVFVFLQPQILMLLIAFTENKDGETYRQNWKGYVFAFAFFLCFLMLTLLFNQLLHNSLALGLRVRAALISAVYKKALTMSHLARKEATVGEIVNLMSIDAQHIQDFVQWIWAVWSGPLTIAVSLFFLYQAMGVSMFAGCGVVLFFVPINGYVLNRIHTLEASQMKQKDHRIKLLTEVLNGIKILKLYAWEMSFKEKILLIRDKELRMLKNANLLGIVFVLAWTVIPYFISLATFATYLFVSEDHYLDAQKAFVAISLFNILRFTINELPMIVSEGIRASVSLKRIDKFLHHEDIDEGNVSHDDTQDDAVIIQNGTFTWDPDTGPCLKQININIPEGSLVAIVGQVGAGKSSMLSAMLGEMIKMKGHVNVKGTVAYVPQQAWIQNATLQDNILFGKPMKNKEYEAVIEACALKPDLAVLGASDSTEIGEKGINLSGGQKQRVSLARAIYFDSDIYYLDDPLSAVDSHVGKHIFEQVIGSTGLLKNKTRILVTHGVQWLPKVDQIIVMDKGFISEIGSYEELMNHNGAFAQFLQTYLTQEAQDEDDKDPDVTEMKAKILQRLTSITSEEGSDIEIRRKSESESDFDKQEKSNKKNEENRKKLMRAISVQEEKAEKKPDVDQGNSKLIEEEEAAVGNVKMDVYRSYAKAVGVPQFIMAIVCFGIYHAWSVVTNIWLSEWTDDEVLSNRSLPANSSVYRHRNDYYLGIYGGLGGVQVIFVMIYAVIFALRSVGAANVLHENLLHTILRSPMSFFDTTPIGRIVNRFSHDIDVVDFEMMQALGVLLDCLYWVVATVLVISYSTPWFLTVVIPLLILYGLIQRFYVTTSRQVKRLESKTRSPIYNHFGETVAGVSVIRAFAVQDMFVTESERRVDLNQLFTFASYSANRWLGIRLDFIGVIVIVSASLFAVAERGVIGGGIVGLSINYAMELTSNLDSMVRMLSEVETNVVSVERITEYIDRPTEADLIIEENRPDPSWPQSGTVDVQNYSTRYRQGLDLVLKNINAHVKPGEKVGIVGRTGAGKSSLTLALFRLIEPASGSIIIDNENISHLGLHDCRSNLTILPQDPVLFSGTLRMNLDPMDAYTEEDIWVALEHAHLKAFVKSLPTRLEYECGEGGQNLSVGQRQLLCLARSLLRKTTVLVLDEATAAVDLETDDLIQETIRTEFKTCTVLTIAHRINTIMDYDRVMVLDQGEIKEFESPDVLLKRKDSLFYQLAKDARLV